MPVPNPRNPIKPARGNYADLQSNVASLQDGEICYAIDQDQFYVKENNTLVLASTNLGLASINALGDVDITNIANGESLVYNNGSWKNGGIMDCGNF